MRTGDAIIPRAVNGGHGGDAASRARVHLRVGMVGMVGAVGMVRMVRMVGMVGVVGMVGGSFVVGQYA